ncbi:MAG: fibronectin type III domain-containing protein, partial [Planctomycetota bacterium]|nr:fibronectin type III domain-containing protein [Planctomycetota bacterium]
CDRGDPPSDSDGSGQCWLTDNSALNGCNSDVDAGTTTLTSPVFSFLDGDLVSYAYWVDSGPGVINNDSLTVEVATNAAGTNWTLLRTYVAPQFSWRTDSIEIGTEVAASSTTRLRFSASDLGDPSLIEAGLDDLQIIRFECAAVPVPSAPTGVSATDGAFCDMVTVSWNSVVDADDYEVWRNTVDDSGSAAMIASGVAATSYDDNAVAAGTHFYWVKACNTSGCSGFSASDAGLKDAVPSAPTGTDATDGACDQVTVTWNAVAGASGYEVWRNTIDDVGSAGQIGSPGGTSFIDNTAVPGTTYFYWVRASNACGAGAFSASDDGVSDSAPSAPTGVSASDNTDCEQITIQWNAAAGATGYEVFRNTVDDSGGAASIGTTGGTSFDDGTAAAGVTYFYWVVAENTCGASGFGLSDDGVARQKGDFNGDGLINGLDIPGYVAASVTAPFFENCGDLAAPFGGTLDPADTTAFVTLLLGS